MQIENWGYRFHVQKEKSFKKRKQDHSLQRAEMEIGEIVCVCVVCRVFRGSVDVW
jgi:hypothetical protein